MVTEPAARDFFTSNGTEGGETGTRLFPRHKLEPGFGVGYIKPASLNALMAPG